LVLTPTAVPQFFQTIEANFLSSWIRDSPSFFGFWFILSVHAIGMALLVGASTIINLRILGVARDLPLAPLQKLYRIIWAGFWLQVISGGLLLLAYPTKSLTNPNFYIKIVLIVLGMIVAQRIRNRVFGDSSLSESAMMTNGRGLAVASFILWVGTVTVGRLLAYTYTHITYPG
jgi:hypothetical protein